MNQTLPVLHTRPQGRRAVNQPFQLVPAVPTLHEVLNELEPLPRGVLFLGQAEDGLPVLLNLHDPAAGPLLILGDKGSGKTHLLQLITQSVISMKTPGQVQFAVLSSRAEEWQERLADAPHCVGVFYIHEPAARQLLRSLDIWLSRAGGREQSVLLLIDGLEAVLAWDESTRHDLRKILAHGPQQKVWPIITARPPRDACLHEWLSLFRSRMTACDSSQSETGSVCPWFSITKNGRQINFWIPALG